MNTSLRGWLWRGAAFTTALSLTVAPTFAAAKKANKKSHAATASTPSLTPNTAQKKLKNRLEEEAEEMREKRERIDHPFDEPAGAAQYYVESRTPDGETIDIQSKLDAASAELATKPVFSSFKKLMMNKQTAQTAVATATTGWSPLGPGNIGGRTRAILIDRKNNDNMWVAGVAGGIWKSTNGGASWTPKGDQLANMAVNSMIQHPKLDNVFFAGTGEGVLNGDAQRGGGIYVSTDYGETWSPLASTVGNSRFFYVNKLATNRAKSQNRIYAATRAGILRSNDYGQTWELVVDAFTTTTPAGQNYYAGCFDLAIQEHEEDGLGNPDNYVYATCGTVFGSAEQGPTFHDPAILRAKDTSGPMTWEVVKTSPNMARTSLAIAPSNEHTIYALSAAHALTGAYASYNDGLEAVYRSTDEGNTWETRVDYKNSTRLNTLLLSNPVYGMFDLCGFGPAPQFLNQGWYDNIIAVDPKNENSVWVGGVDLFRSDDGGANWGVASFWWFPVGYPGYAHADQHMIAFHPKYNGASNRTLFVGNDGGLFRTTNTKGAVASDTFTVCGNEDAPPPGRVVWSDLNNGYAVTQFWHGAMYPDGATFFGGTQDNGTVRGTLGAGPDNWESINGGDGGYVAVNPTNTNILFSEHFNKSMQRSTNGGASWVSVGPPDASGNYLFTAPFAMDPANPSRIWYGGAQPFRSNNSGTSWTAAGPFLSARISAYAVNGDRVYLGARLSGGGSVDGRIWTNGSATTSTSATPWQFVRPRAGQVGGITMDPTNPLVAWATYMTFNSGADAGHVFKLTVDAGTGAITATRMDGTGDGVLPDLPAHAIAIDPDNTNRMYLATDLGLFVTTDGGLHWYQENAGFANVYTEHVEIKTTADGKFLYAFTHGRSAWRLKLN
jgi:hypothetical protein